MFFLLLISLISYRRDLLKPLLRLFDSWKRQTHNWRLSLFRPRSSATWSWHYRVSRIFRIGAWDLVRLSIFVFLKLVLKLIFLIKRLVTFGLRLLIKIFVVSGSSQSVANGFLDADVVVLLAELFESWDSSRSSSWMEPASDVFLAPLSPPVGSSLLLPLRRLFLSSRSSCALFCKKNAKNKPFKR